MTTTPPPLFAPRCEERRSPTVARVPTARADLEAEWLHLTRTVMLALAVERGWPVLADHCFQRILLDNAVGGRWYDAVAARPAYRHIAADRLAEAVRLGHAAIAGTVSLADLNRRSLAWRRAAG